MIEMIKKKKEFGIRSPIDIKNTIKGIIVFIISILLLHIVRSVFKAAYEFFRNIFSDLGLPNKWVTLNFNSNNKISINLGIYYYYTYKFKYQGW